MGLEVSVRKAGFLPADPAGWNVWDVADALVEGARLAGGEVRIDFAGELPEAVGGGGRMAHLRVSVRKPDGEEVRLGLVLTVGIPGWDGRDVVDGYLGEWFPERFPSRGGDGAWKDRFGSYESEAWYGWGSW